MVELSNYTKWRLPRSLIQNDSHNNCELKILKMAIIRLWLVKPSQHGKHIETKYYSMQPFLQSVMMVYCITSSHLYPHVKLKHTPQWQGTRKYMNELEITYVEVVETHTFDGAKTFTLMNTSIKGIRMSDTIMIIIM